MPTFELLYRCEREPFVIAVDAKTAEEAMEKALPTAITFSGNAFTNCFGFREANMNSGTPWVYLR